MVGQDVVPLATRLVQPEPLPALLPEVVLPPHAEDRAHARRIPTTLAPRIRRILSDLDAAVQPRDVDLPGYRLHQLTGDRRGQWSVRVSGNWRIVFRFVNREAVDVTFVDYH